MKTRKSARILLVEDDKTAQLAYYAMLSDEFSVDVVDNGEQALKHYRRGYDAILMDVYLPGIDGIEATQRIRNKNTNVHKTPIIGISIDKSREVKLHCLAAGMNRFFVKPVNEKAIKQTLKELIFKSQRYYLDAHFGEVRLTPREMQCALKLREGKTETMIAGELQLAPSTIGFHINNLKAKLKVASKQQLMTLLLNSDFPPH